MASILIYPGELSDLLAVDDVLQQHHNEIAASRLREIERRKETGAPLDDGDGPIEPLGSYQSDPRIAGVQIQCIALQERQRRVLAAQEGKAWNALRAAIGDPEALAAATDKLFDARRAFIAASVREIRIDGVVFDDPSNAELLDAIERTRILEPIHRAAVAMQELAPGKAWRSGSSVAPDSSAMSAAHARRSSDAHVAVMETHPSHSLPAHSTPRENAQGGT